MSHKTLFIKDWEEFLKNLNVATLESQCVVADVEVELLKHECKDAIQTTLQVGNTLAWIGEIRKHFKAGQEVTCIIFRKEK